MGDQRAGQSEAVVTLSSAILSGAEAVARAARILVGDAVVGDPAVAEGLALTGVRAASVGASRVLSLASELAPGAVSCVHHVTATAGSAAGGHFELAATSAQEAVDDCLAAHLLSQRLGRPGLCSLTPKLAGDLALVQLPDVAEAAERLEQGAAPREPGASSERIAELAQEALAQAYAGRPSAPVVMEGDPEADLVLVAAGGSAVLARGVVRALARAGVPARVAIIRLVRPFPTEQLRGALAGARVAVAVAAPGGAMRDLLAAARAAAGEKFELHGVAATASIGLTLALGEILPECGFDVSRLVALPDPPLAHRLLVTPDTAWGEKTARRVLEELAAGGRLRIGRRKRTHGGAGVFGWSGGVSEAARDLLIASRPGVIDGDLLGLLRPQSAVVVLTEGGPSDEQELSAGARAALREGEHPLYWVTPGAVGEPPALRDVDRAAARALVAAAIRAVAPPDVPDAFALQPSEGEIRRVDPADLAAAPAPQEVDFRAASSLPRMPEPIDDPEVREEWAHSLRHFHRTGTANSEFPPHRALQPAVLATLADEMRGTAMHPFVLAPAADAIPPIAIGALRDVLADALANTGRKTATLADNLVPLATTAARILARGAPGYPLDRLLAEAGDEFLAESALSKIAEAGLRADLAALRAALPARGRVFDLRSDTAVRVYLAVLEAVRRPLERRFSEEVARLCESLRDALQLDRMRSEAGHSEAALASEFGGGANRLLDLDVLAHTLPKDPIGAAMGAAHRQRVAEALEVIEGHLERENPMPRTVFLRPPGVDLAVPGDPPIEHSDPLTAAVGVFDGVASSLVPLFRAVRFARLVAAGSYRPELHDEMLARFDWEAFSNDELSLLPAVTVVTTGRRLRHRGQDSLSELLRSSRPVRVIVCDDIAAADEAEDSSLYHLDLGHLVMAHREAFAVSSTLARPQLLVERLARVVGEPRPGVLLMPLAPRESTPWRVLLAEAGLWGRACPDFIYDPDGGPSWADRFDVAGNPQPECAWPIHRIAYFENGTEKMLEAAFTFADAVALEPAYHRHLRVIPRVAWHDEGQLPLADYVAHFDPERGARGLPFLWVVDDSGLLQRAVVSRELALACRDRLRAWRILQELGGFENAYAERAAAAARETAEAGFARERAELEGAHAEALATARGDGAREAMERLAATLLNGDGLAAVASAPPAVARPAPEMVAASVAASAAAEPAELEAAADEENDEPLLLDDPYIDTILCTSCNECTNLNGQLFAYDGNKQAFIADASAGSFADLVKAAKLCPARCIHPGKPRGDDATAIPELVAQAAKFT